MELSWQKAEQILQGCTAGAGDRWGRYGGGSGTVNSSGA